MNSVKTIEKSHLSFKVQTLATLAAIISAVAMPQIFHVMGTVAGLGSALGEAFLPMHLPIILVGLLAGPYAGAVSGAVAPLISFALTGMPRIGLLPFMVIELCVYGLVSGVLRNSKMPTVVKVLIAQIAGRAVRAIAILISVNALGNTAINISIIWTSIAAGIFGIALQLVIIPLAVYRIENLKKYEE